MSDFRAIGAVSATLQALLYDRMDRPAGVTDIPVTVGPPRFGPRDNEPAREDARLNLFLYRVTENGYLQNQELPGRGSAGAYGHPPLSLNLHFLLTAYGNEQTTRFGNPGNLFDDTIAQFVLGSAMRVLHDLPVVTDQLTTLRPPSGNPVLHERLRGEYERVKLTLEPLTLEDITKVWTALALRYRLSAAYVVNVVQVESRRPRSFPRPVGEPLSPVVAPLPGDAPSPGPTVTAVTIRAPSITELRVRRAGTTEERPYPYARIGDAVVLSGTNLAGGITTVGIGELDIPAPDGTDLRVEATLPDAVIPAIGPIPGDQQLQPGVHVISVKLTDPFLPGGSMRSNESAFMLVPTVFPATLAYAAGPPRSLAIGGIRLMREGLSGETVVGRTVVPRTEYLAATPTSVTVPLSDLLPMRDARILVSGPLPDPVPVGPTAQTLDITIGGTPKPQTANLPLSFPRTELPRLIEAVIRDAAPGDHRFAGTRATLYNDRLVIVAGGLAGPLTITSSAGSTLAADLQLTAAQPPGAGNAALSGSLGAFPALTSPSPQLTVQFGVAPAVAVSFPRPTSLVEAAARLETAIRGAGGTPAFSGTMVGVIGSQLLVIPGSADSLTFGASPVDETTVTELQLQARYGVRVRVNGAESIDDAAIELPQ
jgi:hypothetical protein